MSEHEACLKCLMAEWYETVIDIAAVKAADLSYPIWRDLEADMEGHWWT